MGNLLSLDQIRMQGLVFIFGVFSSKQERGFVCCFVPVVFSADGGVIYLVIKLDPNRVDKIWRGDLFGRAD